MLRHESGEPVAGAQVKQVEGGQERKSLNEESSVPSPFKASESWLLTKTEKLKRERRAMKECEELDE